MRVALSILILVSGLSWAQVFRVGIVLEGQLFPLGAGAFLEYRAPEGGLARAQIGYDYVGPYLLGELGFVLEENPWRRSWASFGGGYYLEGENGDFGFVLAGSGVYSYDRNLGVWGGVMLPVEPRFWQGELGSGGGLALFALLRVRLELAELEFR